MKTLGLVLILACLDGAGSSGATGRQGRRPSEESLSVAEAREVGRKIPCLKVGMTPEEVFDILGTKTAERESRGSGPRWDFRVAHPLRRGYGLLLVWDEGRRFKRAEAYGDGWREGQEEEEGPGGAGRSRTGDCTRPAATKPPM